MIESFYSKKRTIEDLVAKPFDPLQYSIPSLGPLNADQVVNDGLSRSPRLHGDLKEIKKRLY